MSLFTTIPAINNVTNNSGTSFLNLNVVNQAEIKDLVVYGSVSLPVSYLTQSDNTVQFSGSSILTLASLANTVGHYSGLGGDVNSSSELGFVCPKNGTLKNLYVSCRFGTMLVSSTITFAIYNATSTGNYAVSSITFGMSPSSGNVVNGSDLSHTLSVSAGDRIALRISSSGNLTGNFSIAGGLSYVI